VTLDAFFGIGERIALGTHRFDAAAVKAFARAYDPQPFHLDEALAAHSVFGALCASGWHTASAWMRLNVENMEALRSRPWGGTGPRPEWGPSPGFQKLRWPKPVFAGETVSFWRTALSHRRLASRPGWRVLSMLAEGEDSHGDRVLEFEGAVLVKAA
jgi:acyl dehydratase